MNQNKITPENYEGYCELFKLGFISEEEKSKYIAKCFKAGIVPGILFVTSMVFNITDVLVFLSMINFLVVPPVVMCKAVANDRKKQRENLAIKYPNINIGLTQEQIENMLFDANILVYNLENGHFSQELDIDGYRNYAECEKVKNEVINDYTYEITKDDLTISSEQLEKVKVKVKTMSKIK